MVAEIIKSDLSTRLQKHKKSKMVNCLIFCLTLISPARIIITQNWQIGARTSARVPGFTALALQADENRRGLFRAREN